MLTNGQVSINTVKTLISIKTQAKNLELQTLQDERAKLILDFETKEIEKYNKNWWNKLWKKSIPLPDTNLSEYYLPKYEVSPFIGNGFSISINEVWYNTEITAQLANKIYDKLDWINWAHKIENLCDEVNSHKAQSVITIDEEVWNKLNSK